MGHPEFEREGHSCLARSICSSVGIITARAALAKNGTPPPEFVVQLNWVQCVVRRALSPVSDEFRRRDDFVSSRQLPRGVRSLLSAATEPGSWIPAVGGKGRTWNKEEAMDGSFRASGLQGFRANRRMTRRSVA